MSGSDTFNLAAMLDQLAAEIATGKFGDVSACVVFLRGTASNAVVTLPIEPEEESARQLERAVTWLKTGELPP